MAASLGAAWAAAFLWNKAGALRHAMSAVGYAVMMLALTFKVPKPLQLLPCEFGDA